jgi:hypothetical protein
MAAASSSVTGSGVKGRGTVSISCIASAIGFSFNMAPFICYAAKWQGGLT